MQLEFQGHAKQDAFVANLLHFKRNGYFLDIGSCHAISTNNTYCFEAIGWQGICIEKSEEHNQSYETRKCSFINNDATAINYKKLLDDHKFPSYIDYLSLDVDEASTAVLQRLPLTEYKFGIITIEHDFYIHGDIFREEQRKILKEQNYILLFADVLAPAEHGMALNCAFEDWWVAPSLLPQEQINKISAERLYPQQILSRI